MIVANYCGVNIEEIAVQSGSDEEKNLQKRGLGTYPALDVDGTLISDSWAIAAYIARSSGKASLLGNSDFEQAEVDQWMDFLRSETEPIVKALQWYTFGHAECSSAAEYNFIYNSYKDNVKVINKHLGGKTNMVGNVLTIADIYMVLTQVEMQQALIDPNLRNSLQFFNAVFKNVTELDCFKQRMGAVKQGKKQILPTFEQK